MGERPPHVPLARSCFWGGRCVESRGNGEASYQGNKKCCKEVLEDCSICSPATGIQVALNPGDFLARYRNESNFPVRRQSHGTAMITVKVCEGAKATPFIVHKNLLCLGSAYYKAMFLGPWTDKDSVVVNLEDFGLEHFELFYQYIYSGTFHTFEGLSDGKTTAELGWFQAYLLAARLDNNAMAAHAFFQITKLLNPATDQYPAAEFIEAVFSAENPNSKLLREYVVDHCIWLNHYNSAWEDKTKEGWETATLGADTDGCKFTNQYSATLARRFRDLLQEDAIQSHSIHPEGKCKYHKLRLSRGELLTAGKAIGDICREDDWKITIHEDGSVVGEIVCKCQDD